MMDKLSTADAEKYVNLTIGMLLLLYSNYFTPKLPMAMQDIMDNDITRVVLVSYMLYIGSKDLIFSLTVSIVLVLSTKMMMKKDMENYSLLDNAEDSEEEYE